MSKQNNNKSFWPTQPGGRAVSLFLFATDARELGAREVAPDALLVKLPKKKRKIKKSNKSEENPENRKKVLVDPGRHFPVPYYFQGGRFLSMF